MNKVIQNLIEQIVDLKIDNRNYRINENVKETKIKALENMNSELRLELTNMRLVLDEIQKEKGSN